MIVISEQKIGKKSIYHAKTIDSAGREVDHQIYDVQVFCVTVSHAEIYGIKNAPPELLMKKDLVIVTDRDGRIRTDAYYYLNEMRKMKPAATTRKRMGYALQSIYLWCDMHGTELEKMNRVDMEDYIQFLYGRNVSSWYADRDDVTRRSPDVVLGILSMIRTYMTEMSFSNAGLLPKKDNALRELLRKYGWSLGKKDKPAKHCTPAQLKTLIDKAVEMKDDVSLCFMRLCIATGIRGGSFTSMTREDIKTKKGQDGDIYYIILRNRVGDKDWCKGLFHPENREDYKTQLYKKSHQKINISKDIYDFILRYDDMARSSSIHTRRELEKIYAATETDSVESKAKNHYIWQNKRGERLTLQTLNRHLRKLMTACGMETDTGCRKEGVSHKIGRHSFAMLNTTYGEKKATPTEMRDLLGHASVTSGIPYYTPTEEDMRKMSDAFMQQIDNIIFKNYNGKAF